MPRGIGGQSLSNMVRYLKGMDFPASKQELMDYAEDWNAPSEVIEVLERLPEEQFYSMSDLMEELGRTR